MKFVQKRKTIALLTILDLLLLGVSRDRGEANLTLYTLHPHIECIVVMRIQVSLAAPWDNLLSTLFLNLKYYILLYSVQKN